MEDDALALREAGLALMARAAKRKVEDDDEPLIICIASAALAVAAVVLGEDDDSERHIIGPRKKRAPRRLFDVWGAWGNIQRDYLGERALFDGEFRKSFRLSRSREEEYLRVAPDLSQPQF